jgi:hypothetical protein
MIVVFKTGRSPSRVGPIVPQKGLPDRRQQPLKKAADI